jgi:hypothetical protein
MPSPPDLVPPLRGRTPRPPLMPQLHEEGLRYKGASERVQRSVSNVPWQAVSDFSAFRLRPL